MRKITLGALLALMPLVAFADDSAASSTHSLSLNIRRIGLDLSKTRVRNAAEYADSPVQALKATSQDFIKGVFDSALEYKRAKLNWDNSLFMEYGQTKLKPYDGPETSDENADKILLSSDLSYACWNWGGFKFGPTARAAYETEFVASGGTPRQNVLRGAGGLSLFDHEIIKSLYLAGVYEYDFTYSDNTNQKTGAELGWRLEYNIRDGVRLSTNGYYREYFGNSSDVPMDLKRDLSAVLRMDTNLWGNFTMGPYIQYRLARAYHTDVLGSNFMIGVSFNYITQFDLLNKKSAE